MCFNSYIHIPHRIPASNHFLSETVDTERTVVDCSTRLFAGKLFPLLFHTRTCTLEVLLYKRRMLFFSLNKYHIPTYEFFVFIV